MCSFHILLVRSAKIDQKNEGLPEATETEIRIQLHCIQMWCSDMATH